ncbi:MAG: O-antigen ligase family protein [Erythrobacter sp.]|uniref:O-antigen ligase family protein n=1 Tax=Erythrobacter sp. TaxID=1042 RepID=UPI0026020CB5|nr:O-antigen ligase family protein [Erythrobacter sp.]MDJ0979386.1 O-antigen ligase family protein [Erythrobacter sp.]
MQITALGLLACFRKAFFDFWSQAPRALVFLALASVALPLLHVLPLPEAVWTRIPGRTLAASAREAVGANGWAPISLDSARTLVALSGLIVPLTILSVGWAVRRDQLHTLGWLFVLLGIANALIGLSQAFSVNALASFYPETPMQGVLFGTFANRNSAGLFLVGCLALASLLPPPKPHPIFGVARLSVCLLLIVAIVLTRSRTALVLTAIPVLLVGVKLVLTRLKLGKTRSDGSNGAIFTLGALGLAILLGGSLLLASPGRLDDTLERFERVGDARTYIWDDALFVSSRYWPVGSGMGTFDEVFQVDESLENMTQRRAGRAHNDYIEVAIEAGLPGLALIAAWLILVVWFSWCARAVPRRWSAWSGSAICLIIALQSATDYPLRNQTMLALAAFAVLLLMRNAVSSNSPVLEEGR